jgi:hypothetical protein
VNQFGARMKSHKKTKIVQSAKDVNQKSILQAANTSNSKYQK